MKEKKFICMIVSILMMTSSFVLFMGIQVKAADVLQFQDWEYSELSDGTVEVSGYNGSETEIIIPSEFGGKKVTSIGYSAFSGCESLISIEIPASVTSIGNRAFYGCSSLMGMKIPANTTYIGYAAFLNCDSLTSIEVPASVESIGYAAFGYCDNLVSITVDSSSLYYSSGNGILYNRDKTELITCPAGKRGTIVIPEGVTGIVDEAFSSCKSLTGIEVPESVERIGEFGFLNCNSLISIEIPSSVEYIGYKAFDGCTSYLTIYGVSDSFAQLYAKVNNIKFVVGNMPKEPSTEETTTEDTSTEAATTEEASTEAATTEEASTEAVTTGETTTEEVKSEESTTGQSAPQKQTIPVSTLKAGESFKDTKSKGQYKVTGKQTVTYIKTTATSGKVMIPSTVTYKGKTLRVTAVYKRAFKNKTGITSVTLGKNITSIGSEAFSGCKKLKTVTLNANLSKIGDKAFYNCKALASVTIPKNVKKIGRQTFYGCKNLKSITISTTKLTKLNVGLNAFKGINAKAAIKVPKSKKAAYAKLLKSRGAGNP